MNKKRRSGITNVPSNPARLLEEARRIGGHRTKNEALVAALDEYVRRRKQLEVIALFGTIDFVDFDYKIARKKDRTTVCR